jgi:hypothetical protein
MRGFMITVQNNEDDTVCGIDELLMNWGDHINHLYCDHDIEVEMVALRLIDSINNSTCSKWGREDVDW